MAASVIAIAALGYASLGVSASALAHQEADRGLALLTLQRFVERLRADDDWATLYARLRSHSVESADDPGRAHLDVDTSLPTRPATDYYPDFDVPSELGTVTFLVQVPWTLASGVAVLREDAVAPRYGLPFDVSGDGIVDAADHAADHVALPVVVRLRWGQRGQDPKEVVLSTWLREDT